MRSGSSSSSRPTLRRREGESPPGESKGRVGEVARPGALLAAGAWRAASHASGTPNLGHTVTSRLLLRRPRPSPLSSSPLLQQALWDGPRAGIDGARRHILPDGEVLKIGAAPTALLRILDAMDASRGDTAIRPGLLFDVDRNPQLTAALRPVKQQHHPPASPPAQLRQHSSATAVLHHHRCPSPTLRHRRRRRRRLPPPPAAQPHSRTAAPALLPPRCWSGARSGSCA